MFLLSLIIRTHLNQNEIKRSKIKIISFNDTEHAFHSFVDILDSSFFISSFPISSPSPFLLLGAFLPLLPWRCFLNLMLPLLLPLSIIILAAIFPARQRMNTAHDQVQVNIFLQFLVQRNERLLRCPIFRCLLSVCLSSVVRRLLSVC